MHLIRDQFYKHKYDNTNLPVKHVEPIYDWLRARLREIRDGANSEELRREVSKILGKY